MLQLDQPDFPDGDGPPVAALAQVRPRLVPAPLDDLGSDEQEPTSHSSGREMTTPQESPRQDGVATYVSTGSAMRRKRIHTDAGEIQKNSSVEEIESEGTGSSPRDDGPQSPRESPDRRKRLDQRLMMLSKDMQFPNKLTQGWKLLNNSKESKIENAVKNAKGIKLICIRMNNNLVFKTVTSCIILSYIAFLGIQANAVAAYKRGGKDFLGTVQIIDTIFTCVFIVELFIRVVGRIPLQGDKLLPLDFITVASQAVENFVLTPLEVIKTENPQGHWTMLQSLCRMARVASIVHLLRGFRWLEPLYLLIRGIEKSLWCFLFVMMLLSGITVTTALFFVALLRDVDLPPDLRDHFRSLPWTMLTLLEVVLKGSEWNTDITRPLFAQESTRCHLAAAVFVTWVAVIHLCILSVVTAFFIETMDAALADNRERKAQESTISDGKAVELLEEVFNISKDKGTPKFNQDGDSPPGSPKWPMRSPAAHKWSKQGTSSGGYAQKFTWEEIRSALSSHPAEFHKIGITLDVAKGLFKQLSVSGLDGKVQIGDFVMGCVNLTRSSRSIEMLVIDYQQQKAVKDLRLLGSWCTEDVTEVVQSLKQFVERCTSLREQCASVSWTVKDRVGAKSSIGSGGPDKSRARMPSWLPSKSDGWLTHRISEAVAESDARSASRASLSGSSSSGEEDEDAASSDSNGSGLRLPKHRMTKAHSQVRKLWKGTLAQARPALRQQLSQALSG